MKNEKWKSIETVAASDFFYDGIVWKFISILNICNFSYQKLK